MPVALPVEHVPVCLHQSAHEQGVEGTGSDVGLAGGWVAGVEVVRGSRDGRVGKPATNMVRWRQFNLLQLWGQLQALQSEVMK